MLNLPLALFLITCPLLTQQGGMAEADTNNDEKVDAAELKTYVSEKLADFDRFDELMKELDKDGNGSLSAAEFEGRRDAIRTIGQRPRPEPEPKAEPKEPVEFADRYEDIFSKRKPSLGDTIAEDLSAFDENGKPFRFAATRGKYTVIVFGCLT